MKIDFEDKFLDYILCRGYEYYLDNKVNNVIFNDNIIMAIVSGNYKYKVNLEIEDKLNK